MGGNPGAVANGLSPISFPPTEYVENTTVFARHFIRERVVGSRNWEEVLTTHFKDDYPDPHDLKIVVQKCLAYAQENFLPRSLVETYHQDLRILVNQK